MEKVVEEKEVEPKDPMVERAKEMENALDVAQQDISSGIAPMGNEDFRDPATIVADLDTQLGNVQRAKAAEKVCRRWTRSNGKSCQD